MARIVLLDSGPLGLACSRVGAPQADDCRAWLSALELAGADLLIPTVADYEVRRELVRVGATAKLRNLDGLTARYVLVDVKKKMVSVHLEKNGVSSFCLTNKMN